MPQNGALGNRWFAESDIEDFGLGHANRYIEEHSTGNGRGKGNVDTSGALSS